MIDKKPLENKRLSELIAEAINDSKLRDNEIAALCKVTPQAVYSWKNTGRIAKGTLKKLAIATGKPLVYFLDDEAEGTKPAPMQAITTENSVNDDSDHATIVLTNALGSMGPGYHQPDFEQIVDTMRVSRSWVRSNLPAVTRVENLALLPAYGDSMAPTFSDGDLLIVDRGVRDIKVDAVYVIARDGELFVKRVRRRLQDGAVIIKSDNPLFGPDDVITNGDRENLDVLGRVVWSWGGKKI